MRSPLRVVPVVILAMLCMVVASADEFDEPPDTTVTGGARVVTWEPVLLALYAIHPQSAMEAASPTPVPAPPGLKEGWHALKREVAIRSRPFEEGDPIYSGWRMDTAGDDAGQGFHAHVVRGSRDRLVTFKRGEELTLRAALDVLMELSDAEKQEKVKAYFFVDERHVTLHHVSDDPHDIRAVASKDPMPDSVLVAQTRASPFVVPDARHPDQVIRYPLRTKGVFEIRYRARVRGRLSDEEVARTKDVEAAVRFAVSDVAIDVKTLNMNQQGFYRSPSKKKAPGGDPAAPAPNAPGR